MKYLLIDWPRLTGHADPENLFYEIVFATVGVIIVMTVEVLTRDKSAPCTPLPFRFSFLMSDNAKRLLLSYFLIICSLILWDKVVGGEPGDKTATFIGLGIDGIIAFWKNKTGFLKNKAARAIEEFNTESDPELKEKKELAKS